MTVSNSNFSYSECGLRILLSIMDLIASENLRISFVLNAGTMKLSRKSIATASHRFFIEVSSQEVCNFN